MITVDIVPEKRLPSAHDLFHKSALISCPELGCEMIIICCVWVPVAYLLPALFYQLRVKDGAAHS